MNPHLTMKRNFLSVLVITLIVSAIFIFPVKLNAQENQKQAKDQKTIKLKVVTSDNGKVTVMDTTINSDNPDALKEYEYKMQVMDDQMKVMDDQMKEMEIQLSGGMEGMDIDTIIINTGDSIRKRIIIHGARGMGSEGGCDHLKLEGCCPGMPFDFNWNGFDMDDDQVMVAPVFPGQFESILGSIPMGAVKGFKIKEKKGGKRIIIDIDDDYPVMMMQIFNQRVPAPRSARTPRTIIIEKEVNTPPPPPPPAPGKPEAPKEPSKPEKG
jgi:hypothetical protein